MATIRLELTEDQKAQVRRATGREVNVLELRLQGWFEKEAGSGPPGVGALLSPSSPLPGPDPLPPYPGSNEEFKP